MTRKCPICEGSRTIKKKDSTSLYSVAKDCHTCRGKGEVMMWKESLARRLAPGEFSGLASHGFHPTGGIDGPSHLSIVIYPDSEFK